jgi:hypothetical protein
MRSWFAALAMALALSPCPGVLARAAGSASTTDTTWMTVLLGGRRIGHLRIERTRDAETITTTQDLQIELDRHGRVTPMAVLTRSTETLDGQPLGFHARSLLSAFDSTVDGQRQPNGTYAVTTTVAGLAHRTLLAWPTGALLSDGQRQAMAGAAKRTASYTLSLFDPVSQEVAAVKVEVIGNELTALPEGQELLNHQRETLQTPRGPQHLDLWLDANGAIRKESLQMLGHPLDMLACSRACALAPAEDIDMLRAAMVESPQSVTASMRKGFLRYVIHAGDDAQPVIATDEQRIVALGHGDWQVDVGDASPGGQAPPTDADIRPNAWLQSDAPPIRLLAAKAAGDAESDLQKMNRLRDFVGSYITINSSQAGYTSAIEIARTRTGDCKQHAVLLAALARAEGIPARVVSGMVYADRYADSARVFVPHAWVQAWIGGRWQSFDAALGHFDSTHIALDSGDGDPWQFTNLANLFGQMSIAQVTVAPDLAPPVLRGAVASRDW